MRIEFMRNFERYIKGRFNRLKLNKDDFSIIANNCWGTFIYKNHALPYKSPFVNLMLFAPDYMELMRDFSPELLQKLTFIKHEDSKYKDEMKRLGIYGDGDIIYPLGILDNRIELHFLHYPSEEDAKEKWLRRCDRINYERLIFKFSDGDLFEDSMAEEFDKLPYKNKVMFTAKKYDGVSCGIQLPEFEEEGRVHDEWKNAKKYFNVQKFINNIEQCDV